MGLIDSIVEQFKKDGVEIDNLTDIAAIKEVKIGFDPNHRHLQALKIRKNKKKMKGR